MSRPQEKPASKVFILSIKDSEIVFLPDTNEIVSVLRPAAPVAPAVVEAEVISRKQPGAGA